MAFKDLRDKDVLIRKVSEGMGLNKARQLLSTFSVTPEDCEEAIEYLAADNIELIAHIHVDDQLIEEVKNYYPNLDTEKWECQDIKLGDGFKWVVIHCLGILRDQLDLELLKGGN